MSNLAENITESEFELGDIDVIVQVYSHSLERNFAYRLNSQEIRSCGLGWMGFNSIIEYMIGRLREYASKEPSNEG